MVDNFYIKMSEKYYDNFALIQYHVSNARKFESDLQYII